MNATDDSTTTKQEKVDIFFQAIIDFLYAYFPLIILGFVVYLRDGNVNALTIKSDFVFFTAAVFAEGSWRASQSEWLDRSSWQTIGLLGATTSTVLATIHVLSEVNPYKTSLETLINSSRMSFVVMCLLFASAVFAVSIRYKLLRSRD